MNPRSEISNTAIWLQALSVHTRPWLDSDSKRLRRTIELASDAFGKDKGSLLESIASDTGIPIYRRLRRISQELERLECEQRVTDIQIEIQRKADQLSQQGWQLKQTHTELVVVPPAHIITELGRIHGIAIDSKKPILNHDDFLDEEIQGRHSDLIHGYAIYKEYAIAYNSSLSMVASGALWLQGQNDRGISHPKYQANVPPGHTRVYLVGAKAAEVINNSKIGLLSPFNPCLDPFGFLADLNECELYVDVLNSLARSGERATHCWRCYRQLNSWSDERCNNCSRPGFDGLICHDCKACLCNFTKLI